ncbi:MAG: glycerophosphoryl diester phosphodiesterase membrane domain-containing protein [Armatimonadota bacterium]
MQTGIRRLRPLGITDILDETVDLYKSNFALFVGSAAILYIPIFLISGFLNDPVGGRGGDLASILLMLLMLASEAVVTGALTYGISERYLGRHTTIAACYKRILDSKAFWKFIGIVLLKDLITIGPLQIVGMAVPAPGNDMTMQQDIMATAAFLMVIGALSIVGMIWAVYAGTKLFLLEPAFILEAKGGFKSMGRSMSLTKGYFWKIFGLLIIVGIALGLIIMILVGPVYGIYILKLSRGEVSTSLAVLSSILLTVVGTLAVPIPAILSILIYYDIRVRKEGFDLELLANELDRKTQEISANDITSLPQEKTDQSSDTDKQP